MSTTERRPKVEVLRVEDRHADALAEFYRAVWSPEATAASVIAARRKSAEGNLAEPGQVPPTYAVLVEGRIGAYCSSLPIRVRVAGEEQAAYWAKGLMVLPEYRNGPLGFTVLKALVTSLPRSLVLTVAPGSKRLFSALGYTDLGAVPNSLRLLRPERILSRVDVTQVGLNGLPAWIPTVARLTQRTGLAYLGGYAVRALSAVYTSLASWRAAGLSTTVHDEIPARDALDELWGRVAPTFPAGVVRDGAYLTQRYSHTVAERGPYRWVVARRGETLAGAAIVRRPGEPDPRLAGLRLATIADLVVASGDRGAMLALLIGAERAAREWGADGVLAGQSHPAALSALRRRAYLRLPGNVHFFLRNVGPRPPEWPVKLTDWWITRGDGESDAGF